VRAQTFLDEVDRCTDLPALQRALSHVRAEVERRCPDRLPALAQCVREINATDN
jgi:hypothetical protein